MYCKKCGAEIDDDAVVCPHCGVPTDNFKKQQNTRPDDAPNAGFAVLGFFFPIIGLILFLVWRESMPLRSKSCGKGALIGVIVEVALVILYVIFVFAAAGCAAAMTVV